MVECVPEPHNASHIDAARINKVLKLFTPMSHSAHKSIAHLFAKQFWCV